MNREDPHGRLKVGFCGFCADPWKNSLGSHEDGWKLGPLATNLRNCEDCKPSMLMYIAKELELHVEEETETVVCAL